MDTDRIIGKTISRSACIFMLTRDKNPGIPTITDIVYSLQQLHHTQPFVVYYSGDCWQKNKKLSWCWQTCAPRLEVSQGHQR